MVSAASRLSERRCSSLMQPVWISRLWTRCHGLDVVKRLRMRQLETTLPCLGYRGDLPSDKSFNVVHLSWTRGSRSSSLCIVHLGMPKCQYAQRSAVFDLLVQSDARRRLIAVVLSSRSASMAPCVLLGLTESTNLWLEFVIAQ